jgi:hypothetical protein
MRRGKRVSFAGLVTAAGLMAVALAEEGAEIPARFPLVRDRLGHAWQFTSAGSLFQSGANVFESAARLTVNGERFVARRVVPDGDRLVFEGACGDGLRVRRETWIDRDRARACFVETIGHDGTEPKRLTVEIAATMTLPWQTWWARDGAGGIQGGSAPSSGAFLTFPPREGPTDLSFLFGDGKGTVPGRVATSGQTFVIRFEAEVAAGGSLRLGHALGQRRAEPGGTRPAGGGEGEEPWGGLLGHPDNFGAVPVSKPGNGDGLWWETDDGRRGQVAGEAAGMVELWAAPGRVRVPWPDVVSMTGGWWTLRDGSRFHGVALAGQTMAGDVATGNIRTLRREDAGPGAPSGRGLRLRNGDLWAGRPTGEALVLRREDGAAITIPWPEVAWLLGAANGEVRAGTRDGESWTGMPAGSWLEWERTGTTWKVPWRWVEGY